MPEIKKAVYSDGSARGYDASGKLIVEETFEDTYWVDPSLFDYMEDAIDHVVNSYFDPQAIAAETLELARKHADNFQWLDGQAAVVTNRVVLPLDGQNTAARSAGSTDEVAEEKTYLLPEYGVVYRTEGYTSEGVLKDMEHHFYRFTAEGALVMTSSHYRNKMYSVAYDLSYIEYSDIFFTDYIIQTNKH